MKSIKGQKFGRLTAIKETNKRDYRGTVIWLCKCDCGAEKEISRNDLVFGNTKSCGCMKKEIQKKVHQNLTFCDQTCVEWLQKRKHRKDNTSGFRGVVSRNNGTYSVNIGFKNKRYYIGTYPYYDMAVKKRLDAEDIIHTGFVRAFDRWKEDNQNHNKEEFIFEVKKYDDHLEIISSDAKENGRRIEIDSKSD